MFFIGILDGAFAWIISSLGMWFILSRVFKENPDINAISTVTGYAHGIVGSISVIILFQNYINLSARIIEVSILGIFLWLFYTVAKTVEIGFFIDKRSSRIASSVFIIILIWTSGPLKIFFKLNYKVILSYDGNHFHGFQKQPSIITVQQVIEKALSNLLQKF